MAATLPRPDVFTKISNSQEIDSVFFDLAKNKIEMMAKNSEPSSELLLLSPYNYENQQLRCRIIGKSSHQISQQGSIVISYVLRDDKYFQISEYKLIGNEIIIEQNQPIYYLQRREDYRVKINPPLKILLETNLIDNKVEKKSIPLKDLSGGGCCIQLNESDQWIREGMTLKGHLFLLDRQPIEVSCTVRYKRTDVITKKQPIFGLQFTGMSQIIKNKIIALVLDLYRQQFAGRNS